MAIAVVDTNVWLDWLVFGDAVVAPLRAAVSGGHLELVACVRIRDEVLDVIRRPQIAVRCADLDAAADTFHRHVRLADPPPDCGLTCTDPDDQVFLDLAVAERAAWLISKDRDLLSLASKAHRRFALRIAPPARFAAEWAEAASSGASFPAMAAPPPAPAP